MKEQDVVSLMAAFVGGRTAEDAIRAAVQMRSQVRSLVPDDPPERVTGSYETIEHAAKVAASWEWRNRTAEARGAELAERNRSLDAKLALCAMLQRYSKDMDGSIEPDDNGPYLLFSEVVTIVKS